MKTRLNSKLISTLSTVCFISPADIMRASNIARSTWYNIMGDPSTITVQQLLAIANGMHIPVRRFFSSDKADVIGKRDDYITEPYYPCHYDSDSLQEVVSNRADATWRQAAAVAGMSPSHLRNSLLAVTRTPVTRFLTACNAFGIDPFTVLVDPNPEKKRNAKGTPSDISLLRKDIKTLSDTVTDLTAKYEKLLAAHQLLLERIDNRSSHGSTGMAAEPAEEPVPDR